MTKGKNKKSTHPVHLIRDIIVSILGLVVASAVAIFLRSKRSSRQ